MLNTVKSTDSIDRMIQHILHGDEEPQKRVYQWWEYGPEFHARFHPVCKVIYYKA